MKVYARQIKPEYQESPLMRDEMFPEDIAVCGNRYFKEHLPSVFDRVKTEMDDGTITWYLDNWAECRHEFKNVTELITYYLPPEHKNKYSTRDIGKLKLAISSYYDDEDGALCDVLSIVTGKQWDYTCITGCCQSDWNNVYFPVANWSKEALNVFECEYFNTGSEWIIDDGCYNPDENDPDDISGYCVYCTSWDEDGIKQEIANSAGCNPNDVILYEA